MSNTAKKSATRGVRYTDAQKNEIVEFVTTYNKTNGRGGQSKAAEKYNVSQLTISGWLKNAGAAAPGKKISAKAPKAAKAAKAPKAEKAPKAAKAPKKAKGAKSGTRYTPAEKQEVVDFVASYNAENGRGGQSRAAEKFNISPLTVMAWLKGAGAGKPGRKAGKVKVAKAEKASGNGFGAKLNSLVNLNKQLQKAESAASKAQAAYAKAQAEVTELKAKFTALKASL